MSNNNPERTIMGFSMRGIEELIYILLVTHAFVALAFAWIGWMLCRQRHERLSREMDQKSDPNVPPYLTQFSSYEKADEPKKYRDDYPT